MSDSGCDSLCIHPKIHRYGIMSSFKTSPPKFLQCSCGLMCHQVCANVHTGVSFVSCASHRCGKTFTPVLCTCACGMMSLQVCARTAPLNETFWEDISGINLIDAVSALTNEIQSTRGICAVPVPGVLVPDNYPHRWPSPVAYFPLTSVRQR